MRGRHLFWVASWLAMVLSGCKTLQPPRPPQGLETAKACTEWRWIGISRAGARCPEIRGWIVQPLFPQMSLDSRSVGDYCAGKDERIPGPELIQKLNQFCVYEPANRGKGLEGLPFPPSASADLVKFDQDCAALTNTDRELDPKEWKVDAKEFILPEPEARPLGDDSAVRLAFLDTQPTGEGVPGTSGNSPHGFTLMHLARQTLCAPGSTTHCAARITSRLALPIVKFDPKKFENNEIDRERGGFMGMQSDLATAIRDEVDAWRRSAAQRHLVLNLSVAWDGNLFGGLGEDQIEQMRAGTQAVYYALQYAASFDVLVLAAAGNQKVEPCANFGPLLPAAWENSVPGNGICSRELPEAPLLYAVGGVQHDSRPLTNARPGGMPQRAAFGETPVLLSVNPSVYNEKIYSGSSVATAHAASIAAAVWSASPELDSHGVMARLQESGNPLEFNADFGFGDGASPPPVRLLSLCAALELPCSPFNRSALALPRLPGADISSRGSCQPWLHPQPDDPPCLGPNCPPQQISK